MIQVLTLLQEKAISLSKAPKEGLPKCQTSSNNLKTKFKTITIIINKNGNKHVYNIYLPTESPKKKKKKCDQ